jgi:hypothetical protein
MIETGANRILAARARLEALIDSRIYRVAPEIVRGIVGNTPPGGMHPIEVSVASPAASASAEVIAVPVLYKCNVESVLLVGDTTGTATVDIKRARPGETVAGDSLFGANPPALSSGSLVWVEPAADWVRYIEPRTVLFFYVTAASGLSRLDIALNVRALVN